MKNSFLTFFSDFFVLFLSFFLHPFLTRQKRQREKSRSHNSCRRVDWFQRCLEGRDWRQTHLLVAEQHSMFPTKKNRGKKNPGRLMVAVLCAVAEEDTWRVRRRRLTSSTCGGMIMQRSRQFSAAPLTRQCAY